MASYSQNAIESPLKVQGRSRKYFNNSQSNIMKEIDSDKNHQVTETRHIIKFKASKEQESPKKAGAISKARHAIKKRINTKKSDKKKKKCYASDTKGIEASLKLSRSETFMKKMKETSILKAPARGRSRERRRSDSSGNSLKPSGMKRSKSLRSLKRSLSMKRSRSKSITPSILSKVKSFRRSKSLASVRSVRSTRSNFSVRSRSKKRGGLFSFFRRKNKGETTPTGERVLYVKQEHTPETIAPTSPDEPGLFNSLMCNSFDVTVCRDLFCRPEEVDDFDNSYIVNDDDPRFLPPRYAEESSSNTYTLEHNEQQGNAEA